MKRIVALLLTLIMVLVSTACGSIDGDSAKAQPDSSKAGSTLPDAADEKEKSASPSEQTVFHVGEICESGDLKIIYMASGAYQEENEFMRPEEGHKYISLTFAFENTSNSSDVSVSSFDFACYADGYACDAYYGGEKDVSATLSPGRQSSGSVYFEVPADAAEIEVEYETNWFSGKKVTFLFEGDTDSGYAIEKNTEASADALKVGDTASSSSLNITYLNCFTDSSDNMFITPESGYHYVTCEMEFENVSASDQFVSVYSFDCFADGVACELAYFRDDAISATLSAGRKAKGTVTFEVPDNAEIIEVEYLSSFWSSSRVVFDASGN